MKKAALFFICIISLFNASVFSQSKKSEKQIESVKDINLSKIRMNPFMKKGQKADSVQMISYPDIYALGFSKEGLFAYITCRSVDGRGGSKVIFQIIDLVTDDIVNRIEKDTDDSYEIDAVKEMIFCEGSAMDKALKDNSIIINNCTWKTFPVTHRGTKISVNIEKNILEEKEYDFLTKLDYKITASNGSGKEKILAQKKNQVLEDVYACGYFENPYEDRIAVIIGEEKLGFEGSHDIYYECTGCNLNVWK
ncbi:MAG: hypothetical protein IKX23_04810 [Treponema sp.]|nr:hypothetical protein [Treponema sp.]